MFITTPRPSRSIRRHVAQTQETHRLRHMRWRAVRNTTPGHARPIATA